MNEAFFVCVDGIYAKEGKILLLKRSVGPFKGYWHVAGGHVEENETLKEAIKREFWEETGLNVKTGKIIATRIEKTRDRTKIIVAFEVANADGEIRLNSEHSEYGWFDKNPPHSIYDYTKFLIRKKR